MLNKGRRERKEGKGRSFACCRVRQEVAAQVQVQAAPSCLLPRTTPRLYPHYAGRRPRPTRGSPSHSRAVSLRPAPGRLGDGRLQNGPRFVCFRDGPRRARLHLVAVELFFPLPPTPLWMFFFRRKENSTPSSDIP
ncbi:hypothetical protein CGRA01v4_14427 [Colletotrichum graminicola]|nr:hypothetical protein CGRA01v4_14427 [Colletotrichum graminicola]